MKQRFYLLIITVLTLISSCSKDTINSNRDVIGNWVWKYGYSSGGVRMSSTDTTKILFLEFKKDNSFLNKGTPVIDPELEGNYQIGSFDNERIIILKSQNTRPDTLKLSVVANRMILTETYEDYSWSYYFDRN